MLEPDLELVVPATKLARLYFVLLYFILSGIPTKENPWRDLVCIPYSHAVFVIESDFFQPPPHPCNPVFSFPIRDDYFLTRDIIP